MKRRLPIVLFDIDGTLIWSHGAGKAAIDEALKEQFGDHAGVDGVRFHGRTDRAIMKDAFALSEIEDTDENRERALSAYVRLLPRSLTQKPGKVLPGVAELLRILAAAGCTLGLLTGNIRRGARVKLENYGLASHFSFEEFGGFGDLHIDRNDVAVEALASVRRRFGDVDPREIWVLGDTPADIQCAQHIGARSLAVATGGALRSELETESPDAFFQDFSDAKAVVDVLCG